MLSLAEMAAQFRADPNKEYRVLVGFEWEVFLYDRKTLFPIRYEGERGLGAILAYIREHKAGEILAGKPANKCILPDGGQISIEPGGQFEFSSAPSHLFGGAIKQFHEFLALVHEICDHFDLHVFYGAAQPVHSVDDIGLVIDNPRYQIMNDYFPRVGALGRKMMRQTTSVQVTFDYRDREIGTELFRAAAHLAPLAAALFAHSPYIDNRITEYRSYRGPIWLDTDPSRCGLPPGFNHPDYSFLDYVSFINDAPLFYIPTDDGPIHPQGMSFSEFNEHGYQGRKATMDDFLLHSSTIFTDARLKNTVEVRSIDGQDPSVLPAVVAFLSGLLLCNTVRPKTLAHLESLNLDYHDLLRRLPKEGLTTMINAKLSTQELIIDLIEAAKQGMSTCFEDGKNYSSILDGILDLAKEKKTPADLIIERFKTPMDWLKEGKDNLILG